MKLVSRENLQGYTVLRFSGMPTAAEMVKSVDDYYREAPAFNTVWDFSECPMDQLSVSDYSKIIAAAKKYTGTTRISRSALVMKTDLEQLLAETFEEMAAASELPIQYRIFGSSAEAEQWFASS